MTRKILSGAEVEANWTSVAGALQGVLRFRGAPLPRESVMGLSGHAFRLTIWTGSEGIAGDESPFRFDQDRALTLYQGLGFAIERASAVPTAPDYARRREEAVRRIRRSIDRGRPVVAYGLQVPEFGIVKGYDDREELLYVSTTVSPQYGEGLPLRQWPAPGHLQAVEVILPGDRRSVDPRRAERSALAFAVQYADHGEPETTSDTAHGLAAYERWLAGYTQTGSLARAGNARSIQIVQAARRDAAAFLRRIAHAEAHASSAALLEAAAAYEREALAFSRLATLFPFPNGGDTMSAGTLAVGAASLREALAQEQSAVAALRAALASL